jgi:hypothetical protein
MHRAIGGAGEAVMRTHLRATLILIFLLTAVIASYVALATS